MGAELDVPDVALPSPAGGPDFRAEWLAALARLEADVEIAEAALRVNAGTEVPAWEPPDVRTPLPEDLEPRARLVLERQIAVAALLTEKLTATARERDLAQRFRDTAHPDIPVYVDLDA